MTLTAVLIIVINVLRWNGCSSLAAVVNNYGVIGSGGSSHQRRILRSSRDYNLLEIAPHDITAFTQGLTYHNGYIYEGTGLEGQSRIMQLDPTNNMQTLHSVPLLPSHLFGEGIAAYHTYTTDVQTGKRTKEDRVIQLTWTSQIGRIYTIPKLQLIQEFYYNTTTNEGWGITYIPNTNEFAISDGSEYITFWNANTLLETRKILVTTTLLSTGSERESSERSKEETTKTGTRIKYINELELVNFHNDDDIQSSMTLTIRNSEDHNDDNEEKGNKQQQQQCKEEEVEGGTPSCTGNNNNIDDDDDDDVLTPTMYILANIWYEDVIVRIHPVTGNIDRIYDLSDLYPAEQRNVDGADCLNGIAAITTPDGTTTAATTASRSLEGGRGGSVQVWVTGKLWPFMYRIELIG